MIQPKDGAVRSSQKGKIMKAGTINIREFKYAADGQVILADALGQTPYQTIARVQVELHNDFDDFDDYGVEYKIASATLDGCEITVPEVVDIISNFARGREGGDHAARCIQRALRDIFNGADQAFA